MIRLNTFYFLNHCFKCINLKALFNIVNIGGIERAFNSIDALYNCSCRKNTPCWVKRSS
ncbi:hypothetical protein Hanom_Chr17g01559251 [Helianthus anomalus]